MVKAWSVWALSTVSVAVSAGSSKQPYCCGDGAAACASPDSNTTKFFPPLEHWCLDTIVMKQVQPIENFQPSKTKQSLYHCLSGCELDFRCYFATCEKCDQSNGDLCTWYGRGGNNTNQLAWMLVQTDDTSDVPKPFTDGTGYDKVQLGPGLAKDFAQCKEWWVSAFFDGTVDQNIGQFTDNDRFFTFADVQTGKGNVRVKARYVETSRTNGSAALQESVSCNGNLLVYTDKNVKLQSQDSAQNYVWKLSGQGMYPADRGGQCLTVQDSNPDDKKNDQKAAVADFVPDAFHSQCISFDTPSSDADWISSVEDWGQAANYGMGECDLNADSLQMWHLKRDQGHKPKTCGGKACGKFEFSLVGDDEHPDQGLEQAEVVERADSYNCFGFKSTTTTTTTTTTTATIQYCVGMNDGGNAFTIGQCPGSKWFAAHVENPDSFQICTAKFQLQSPLCLALSMGQDAPSIQLEFQGASDENSQHWNLKEDGIVRNSEHPGICLGSPVPIQPGAIFSAFPCDSVVKESVGFKDGAMTVTGGVSKMTTAVTQVADEADEFCPAVFPGVSVPCMAGTTCCGRNTQTPECYFAEHNSCCQPEGSSISILCAKDQGCSSIDGLPTCVPAGDNDACSCAQNLGHKGLEGNYYCKPSHSSMCYHAPDRHSCQETYGQDASFCYVSPAGTITLI